MGSGWRAEVVRCSNSYEPDGGFFAFLRRSLDAIAEEVPLAHGAMCRALGAKCVELRVDGETMCLSASAGRHVLTGPLAGSSVAVELNRAAVVGLLEGRYTLVQAVLRGDVLLRGAADDLASLSDALTAFVQGAVRSVSAPELLDAYLLQSDRSQPAPESGANLPTGYPS
jgi:hypothetical protein